MIEDFDCTGLPFLRSKTITCLSMMPSSEFGNTCGRNAGLPTNSLTLLLIHAGTDE